MDPAAIGTAGGNQPHENQPPYLALYFCIAEVGIYPSNDPGVTPADTDQYTGEIRMVGFNFAPNAWALCNGQILTSADNTTLAGILKQYYGGSAAGGTYGLP